MIIPADINGINDYTSWYKWYSEHYFVFSIPQQFTSCTKCDDEKNKVTKRTKWSDLLLNLIFSNHFETSVNDLLTIFEPGWETTIYAGNVSSNFSEFLENIRRLVSSILVVLNRWMDKVTSTIRLKEVINDPSFTKKVELPWCNHDLPLDLYCGS